MSLAQTGVIIPGEVGEAESGGQAQPQAGECVCIHVNDEALLFKGE